MPKPTLVCLLLFLAASVPGFACAAPFTTEPATLQLAASASRQVTLDEMVVNLSVERDGPAVGALNATVMQELTWAIAQAKAPGGSDGIEASLGGVSTRQNHGPTGKANGWKVRGEVTLKSKNMPALGALVGRLGARVQLNGVTFQLSNQARQTAEAALISKAARTFDDRATAAARALGYSGYAIKTVSMSGSWPEQPPMSGQPQMEAMASLSAVSSPAMPAASGNVEVSVSFAGTVSLKR